MLCLIKFSFCSLIKWKFNLKDVHGGLVVDSKLCKLISKDILTIKYDYTKKVAFVDKKKGRLWSLSLTLWLKLVAHG